MTNKNTKVVYTYTTKYWNCNSQNNEEQFMPCNASLSALIAGQTNLFNTAHMFLYMKHLSAKTPGFDFQYRENPYLYHDIQTCPLPQLAQYLKGIRSSFLSAVQLQLETGHTSPAGSGFKNAQGLFSSAPYISLRNGLKRQREKKKDSDKKQNKGRKRNRALSITHISVHAN